MTVAVPAPQAGKQVIAVVSGKGGAGTSVIAANLALIAANEAKRHVAIVDLDLQHGDQRRLLRVDAKEGIVEVAAASPTADRQVLLPRMPDGPAGLMTLLAPATPSLDSLLSPEFVSALLLQMRALVDIVVLDIPAYLTPASAAALRAADRVVLVCSMTDPGVRATKGMLDLFKKLQVPADRIVIALNRNEANSDMVKATVEEALGRPVAVQLPYDAILISTSINRGAPFVLQKPDAQVSRRVRELAGLLFPVQQLDIEEAASPKRRAPEPAREEADKSKRRGKKKGLFSMMTKED